MCHNLGVAINGLLFTSGKAGLGVGKFDINFLLSCVIKTFYSPLWTRILPQDA